MRNSRGVEQRSTLALETVWNSESRSALGPVRADYVPRFLTVCSVMSPWELEMGHRGRIYTTEVGRHHEPGLIFSEMELSKQHTTERPPHLGEHTNTQHTEWTKQDGERIKNFPFWILEGCFPTHFPNCMYFSLGNRKYGGGARKIGCLKYFN